MATKAVERMAQDSGNLEVKRKPGFIWSYLRSAWLVETPEERVRQEYLCVLVNEYGYSLEQIGEELSVPGAGSGGARADFLIWRSVLERAEGKKGMIVVECKSDNVSIDQKTYQQGANYANYEHARFFVTHNNRETKFWKVDLEKRAPNYAEIANIPHAQDSAKEIEELLDKLKAFKEDEFADLLRRCHNVIRNREHKDPAAAFDEIAKILFLKVSIERRMRQGRSRDNLFTRKYLEEQGKVYSDPLNSLFRETRHEYRTDKIFAEDESINLRLNTALEIVELLERYDLSNTSEDIKGIAFERFLGRTFRGEIGQFFTPRPIVEFMIRMLDPQEGQVVCDPASGSGGFLIRFFEIVREKISASIDAEYQAQKARIEALELPDEEKARKLKAEYDKGQAQLDQGRSGSRLWKLANRCIYGTDANDRMARTSKMNMIMHGDGHGGVHHHNGFLNVNGIFENRFHMVLTNPPFGASVEKSDVVSPGEVELPEDVEDKYLSAYGEPYREARERLKSAAASRTPIAKMFQLPRGDKIKTEILFIERCLDLLLPGGKLGIVLPEGVFNTPSLAYVREWCEDRAWIRAVVSLPPETFVASGASVKASLLFLEKFSEAEQQEYAELQARAEQTIAAQHEPRLREVCGPLEDEIAQAKKARDPLRRAKAQSELKAIVDEDRARQKSEARAWLRERWDYAIFLYEAEKVGFTATGAEDFNELVPPDPDKPELSLGLPAGVEKSCLELYREFRADESAFEIGGDA